MSAIEDPELVQKCRSGSQAAFAELVERYQKMVYNTALRIVGDRDEAEDVAQAAFVKAFERLQTYDPQHRFFSWLYRITLNEALNVVRHRKRFQALDHSLAGEDPRGKEIDLEEGIQDALMELKMDHRALIVLKHFQGLSYEEIAQVLDISEAKVKSRLFSARMVLKDALIRRGFGNG